MRGTAIIQKETEVWVEFVPDFEELEKEIKARGPLEVIWMMNTLLGAVTKEDLIKVQELAGQKSYGEFVEKVEGFVKILRGCSTPVANS